MCLEPCRIGLGICDLKFSNTLWSYYEMNVNYVIAVDSLGLRVSYLWYSVMTDHSNPTVLLRRSNNLSACNHLIGSFIILMYRILVYEKNAQKFRSPFEPFQLELFLQVRSKWISEASSVSQTIKQLTKQDIICCKTSLRYSQIQKHR